MKPTITKLITILLLLGSPALAEEQTDFHKHFAGSIGTAHGIKTYYEHKAVQADISVTFGDRNILQGVITFDTPVGKSHIKTKDGVVMVLDGKDAWVAPADAELPPGRARFMLLTWPYFIAAPFKLADPGTSIEDAGKKPLDAHRILPAGKLTFSENVGDSPEDWYMVYRDPDNDRLAAMAYIVTYGKSADDAEESPHMVIYETYEEVDGVTLPTRMSFWNWSPVMGKIGEPLGEVNVSGYQFIEPEDDLFTKPEGARIDPVPPTDNEG